MVLYLSIRTIGFNYSRYFSFFKNFSNFRTTDTSRPEITLAISNIIRRNKCFVPQKNFRNFRRHPHSHPIWFHLEANNNCFILSKNFRNFRELAPLQGSNVILVAYSRECRCLCAMRNFRNFRLHLEAGHPSCVKNRQEPWRIIHMPIGFL